MFDLDRLHQHISAGHLADQLRPLTWKKLRQGPNIVEVTMSSVGVIS